MCCQLNLISKKGPNAKMRKMQKKKQQKTNIQNFFLACFAHSTFYKIHFLEHLTAMPQFNTQNMFYFFLLSSHHDTNPLLHLHHFRKNIIIYLLILTKFIFLEQLTAMPQHNMQNMFYFLLLSSHHDTNPLLHWYHFRKKYHIIIG